VVTDAQKCGRQIRFRVEHEELHRQTRQPKDRDERADGTGECGAGRQFVRVEEGERAEGDDHEDNERAVNPEEPPQEWMQRREIGTPIEDARRERARYQNHEVQQAAGEE